MRPLLLVLGLAFAGSTLVGCGGSASIPTPPPTIKPGPPPGTTPDMTPAPTKKGAPKTK